MLPPVSPPSLPIKDTIQTSPYIQNETLPLNELESITMTSTPSTNSSKKKWCTRKSDTKDLLMLDELQHQTSKSVTVYSSKQNTSDQLDPPRNSLKRTEGHTKSLLKLELFLSLSNFQI